MYPFEALPGDVYVRDGEKVAEVARGSRGRADDRGGRFNLNDGCPSVLSPDERLQVLEGFVGGYYIQLHSLGLAILANFLIPGARRRDFAEIIESRTTWSKGWLMGEAMPQESNWITLKRDVRDRFGLRVPNVHSTTTRTT
jgi:hypothetical protein